MTEDTKDENLPEVETQQEKENKNQARQWCLTINNPEMTDDEFEAYLKEIEHIKYFIFQRERGLETGTEHLQIYMQFVIGKRFTTIKNLFPKAHIESARGSAIENRAYCTKSETKIGEFREYGELSTQGSRSDIKEFIEFIQTGASNADIRKNYSKYYVNHFNKLVQIRQEMLREKYNNYVKDDFIVVYIYGSTGTGKTSSLFNYYGNQAFYVKNYSSNPWDTYDNQQVVVFDRFNSQVDFDLFINYIDPFPLDLSKRYMDMFGNYNTVFILTNIKPGDQYSFVRSSNYGSWQGFERRLHFIIKLEKDKAYLEKQAEDKTFEDLKKVLPTNILNKLDTSLVFGNQHSTDPTQVKFFEITPDDELPF